MSGGVYRLNGYNSVRRINTRRVSAGGGWWDLNGTITSCVAAYQPKGAASYAASKVNLANPGTYDVYEGTAPDWDVTYGWQFVESSKEFLETDILPTANTSGIVRFSNANTSASYILIGSYSGNEGTRFLIGSNNKSYLYEHATYKIGPSGSAHASGVMAIAGQEGFYNGSKECDIPGTWSGTATKTMRIGHQNGYTVYCTAYIQAIAIYNATLTAQNVADLTDAMNAL